MEARFHTVVNVDETLNADEGTYSRHGSQTKLGVVVRQKPPMKGSDVAKKIFNNTQVLHLPNINI
jgi:hypothetical protein